MTSSSFRRNSLKLSYRLHRTIGLCIALPILVIAVTGILLNHSVALKLNDLFITNQLVLSWYNLVPRTPAQGAQTNKHWFVVVEDLLYCDAVRLSEISGTLRGAAVLRDISVVATTAELIVVAPDCNSVVEKLGPESLPAGEIKAIEAAGDRFFVETSSGVYESPPSLANFQISSRSPLASREPGSPPPEILERVLDDWRQRGISAWRVIIDMHSGAIFGRFGSLIGDVAALALIALVWSGWYNSRRKRAVR